MMLLKSPTIKALQPRGLDFTVECWIKSSDGSSTNMAFVTNYGGGAQNPFFMLGFDNSNAFFWVRDASRTSSQATTSKGNVVDGTWHHLAGVRSSTGTFLYLDGVLVSTAAAQTAAVNSGSTISLMDHFNRYTAGQLDEVRIWDDARTLTELRDNMCQKTKWFRKQFTQLLYHGRCHHSIERSRG